MSSVNVTVDVEKSACNLTTSTVTYTGNGEHTITPPEGYDGFSEVVVNIDSECNDRYDEGVADQKAKLESATFNENGSYTREDGWNNVTVDVDTVTPYNNGKKDGADEQKAKLTDIEITENGTYRRSDGYKEVVLTGIHTGSYGVDLDTSYHLCLFISASNCLKYSSASISSSASVLTSNLLLIFISPVLSL